MVSGLLLAARHLPKCPCLVGMQRGHELRLWLDFGFPVLGARELCPLG